MKRAAIIAAKILDRYAELIERSVKRYEVRSDPLEGADATCFLGSKVGIAMSLEAGTR